MEHEDRLKAALADHYRIERESGSGGMATVYRAHDLKHDRTVAIKVLRPDLAEAIGADRFLREIRTTANLTHPHILPLHDSGQADGLLFFVMPFVEGGSLRDRLEQESQLPVEDAVQIAREVADALAYAHEKGIIHRDVKPANIMLDRGHALLADFGVAQAKAGADETRLTGTGMSLGTPSYMSPEQISGNEAVDGRADQYALGCVLYEMLAGEPPFAGADIRAVLRQHLAMDPTPVTVPRPSVPRGIAAAVARAMAKGPADRFRTTAEFREALAATGTAGLGLSRKQAFRPLSSKGLGTVGLVAVLGLLAYLMTGGPWDSGGAGSSELHALAVLPCLNSLDDSTLDYVATGVRNEIQIGLGDIDGIEVRGQGSVMQFQATVLPVREIARELRVSGLVECTVLAIGDAVRLTVSLLDASRDAQVWGDSYQRPREDVFQLGRDAALGIAEKLLPVVTAEDRARVATLPTDNREAYSLYQRAREVWSRMGEDNFRMAIELLNQAIALDSTFALAHALKARVFMDGGDLGGSPSLRSTDYREAARASVERALDLDPLLAEGHATLGELNWYHEYDYAAGERESRQAVALDSANALAWAGYGFSQSLSGRDEEAVAALRRAVELDPKDRTLLGNLVWILNVARRYKEAREESREARRLFPEGWNFYLNEAIAALYLGDSTEAVRLQEQASDLHAHPHDLATLGRFYASVGRRQEALAMLDSLKAMAPEGLVNPRSFGYIYMGLDSLDAALDWFIRAAEERDPGLNVNLRAEDYDGIRDHPRYPELLRALRLER